MNRIKKITIALLVLLLSSTFIYSQDIDRGEFMIVNQTSSSSNPTNITVKIYPVGAIFNGADQYTVKARYPINEISNPYIFGKEIAISYDQNGTEWYKRANFDKSSDYLYCDFSLGYGRYRIDFYEGTTKTNTCDVDFSDANFTGTDVSGYIQHLRIDYNNSNDISFQFINPNSENVNIAEVNNYIKVWEQVGTENTALTPSKGNFTDSQDPASQFHAFPLDATSFGHFAHVTPEEVKMNLKVTNFNANIISSSTLSFSDCCFTLNDGKTFTVNGGQQLRITGGNGKFVSGNNSIVNMTENSIIKIYNYAKVEAIGTWFQTSNSYIHWKGFDLYYPGESIFDNCKFYNGVNAINSFGNGSNLLSIQNCLFEDNYDYALQVFKTTNLFLYNNIFNLGEFDGVLHNGIWILNSSFSEEENNSQEEQATINIINNEFNNGTSHLWAIGLAANQLPLNIERNKFNNGSTNMILEGTTGTVYKNELISNLICGNCFCQNIYLNQSNPDFLENIIRSNCTNLYMKDMSYPNFEPIIYEIQPIYWVAGKNQLSSNSVFNVSIEQWGDLYSKYGKNTFNINNENTYHFFGFLDTYSQYYYSYGNCWKIDGNSSNPAYTLINRNNQSMIIETGAPGLDCNWEEQETDNLITFKGHEIYDTILITKSNISPQLSSGDALYSAGVYNQKTNNFSTSIDNYKNLINLYTENKNIERVIFNLYECYVSSDTNHNQNWRNIIFTDLKNFLESKIQQYQNNDEFVKVAFEFYIKCKIKIKSYQQAMDGYDFIANNSPSATERLMASINYIDVEGLLQGSGSGMKETGNLSEEQNSIQNGKPIKDILLASYEKTKEQIKLSEKNVLKNSGNVKTTKEDLNKKHKYEKKLEDRAKENISISGSLSKTERRERIQKDLLLLHNRDGFTAKNTKSEISVPLKYELSQNYPNPFNPITNIKYQIQKTGLATLKIYDLLGREIKTLVNEVKNPGSYMVSFNGAEFASGVYFYRIQSGDFIQVKKMLMIK